MVTVSSPVQHRTRTTRGVLRSTSTNAYYPRIKQDDLEKPNLDEPAHDSDSLSDDESPPVPPEEGRGDSTEADKHGVCYHPVPLNDMSAHRKLRVSGRRPRPKPGINAAVDPDFKPGICKNVNCRRTLNAIDLHGVMVRPSVQDGEMCSLCHGGFVQFYSDIYKNQGQIPSGQDFDCQPSRLTGHGSEMVLDHGGRDGPIWRQREAVLDKKDFAKYLQYKNRARKDVGKDGKEVWPDHLEEAFQIGEVPRRSEFEQSSTNDSPALCKVPHIGRRRTMAFLINGRNKSCGRNELLAETLQLMTGIKRLRKQVSSHIQVLQGKIKSVSWLMHIRSEPSKAAGEATKGLQYNSYTGDLIISESSMSSTQDSRSTSNNARLLDLPPPTKLLGSSTPPQYPSVLRIELNMSVFPPQTIRHIEGKASHIYTRIQDEMGAQARPLEDDGRWREQYPDLANLIDSRYSLKSEVVLLESSLELMRDYSPPKSSLAIQLCADVACPSPDASWGYQTRFYKGGLISQVSTGQLDITQRPDSTRTNMTIPLSSSWWVTLFHEIMERRCAIRASGDPRELYRHEQQTRKDISDVSVMQEIYATVDKDSNPNLVESIPAIILLWKFRQTQRGEAATTSWRRLHLPPPRVAANSPILPLLQAPMILDSIVHGYNNSSYAPLLPSQMQLPQPLQHGTRYDQWPQPSSGDFSVQDEDISMDFKAESPNATALNAYDEDEVLQVVPMNRQMIEDHDGRNYIIDYGPTPRSQSKLHSHAPDTEGKQLVGRSQQTEYELHSFESHEEAAYTLSELANHPLVTDISSQSATTESASQSATANYTSQTQFTSFSTNDTTDYLQDTPNSNLELDVANWNIQLHYENDTEQMEPQTRSKVAYNEIGLDIPTTSTEHDTQEVQQLSSAQGHEIQAVQMQNQQHQSLCAWPYPLHGEHGYEAPALVQEDHSYNLMPYPQAATLNREASDRACHAHEFAFENGHWVGSGNTHCEGNIVPYERLPPSSLEAAQQQHLEPHEVETLGSLAHLPLVTQDPYAYTRDTTRQGRLLSPVQIMETIENYREAACEATPYLPRVESGLYQSHANLMEAFNRPRFLPMDSMRHGEDVHSDGMVETENQVAVQEQGHVLGEVDGGDGSL